MCFIEDNLTPHCINSKPLTLNHCITNTGFTSSCQESEGPFMYEKCPYESPIIY